MIENLIGTHKPDILDCIANLSNDEVFTPPKLVGEMLDLLPAEVWTNPNLKFLDPASKTGVFLREAATRLMSGLAAVFPDETQRRNHIFREMLHGLAVTELTGLLSRRSLYCSKDAASRFSVVRMPDCDGNIRYERGTHVFVNGKCKICGAPEGSLDRGEHLENYAYGFIHHPEKLTMKFDVIIGNPPYQLQDAGDSTGSSPIYHLFVEQAKRLDPKYICMIIPARWYAGGKGLDAFRSTMLNDSQIRTIVDYTNASEIFPGVDISAGICYFLWEKGSTGPTQVVNHLNGATYESFRPLNQFDTFVRYGFALPILDKIKKKETRTLNEQVYSSKPFGLRTNAVPDAAGDLNLFWSGGLGKIQASRVTSGLDIVSKWKTVTSRASYDHGGMPDARGQRRVLSRTAVLPPDTVCTETYLVLGAYESQQEAEDLLTYMKTKFFRFLVALHALSQDITRERFAFVPLLDMSRSWTDGALYEYFELDPVEIGYIESMIKEMP